MLIKKFAANAWCLLNLISLLSLVSADTGTRQAFNGNIQVQEFIGKLENLVLNTTDRALIITQNVYLNLTEKMPMTLRNSTKDVMLDYIRDVDEVLGGKANYTEKREMLKKFKANNEYIERLRQHLAPQQVPLEFQLISDAFYNEGKNCTEFDALYLDFVGRFDAACKDLWGQLTEQTVEEQEELLEILDEISKEQNLREKDKLYDEFIEIYLFRPENYEEESKLLI